MHLRYSHNSLRDRFTLFSTGTFIVHHPFPLPVYAIVSHSLSLAHHSLKNQVAPLNKLCNRFDSSPFPSAPPSGPHPPPPSIFSFLAQCSFIHSLHVQINKLLFPASYPFTQPVGHLNLPLFAHRNDKFQVSHFPIFLQLLSEY